MGSRLEPLRRASAERLPRWLGGGALRLLAVCAFVIAMGMISPRVDQSEAGALALGGLLVAIGAVAAFLLLTRRVLHRLPVAALGAGLARAEAVLLSIRRVGLLLLGLAFMLLWTEIYLGVWWFRPEGAFSGLGEEPRIADFFYYAVSTAFINPPGDISALSRGARTATMVEMLTAAALLSTYLGSFVNWTPDPDAAEPPAPVADGEAATPG